MIINHNMASLNTYNKLSTNNANTSKSLEKLSSGLRINRAGDDAAGLAISEKMRGQIRGLDQASRNAQDANSLLNTAEGNLAETQSILQRMKELATQAANDTNVGVDRGEIQKEINQLTSEINRIGNTTEFNTQKLLNGAGSISLDASGISAGIGNLKGGADAYKTESSLTNTITTMATATGDNLTFVLNGQTLTVNFKSNDAARTDNEVFNATATAASVNVATSANNSVSSTAEGAAAALQAMIDKNDALAGGYKVTAAGANVTIEAVKGGRFDGVLGNSNGTAGVLATAVASGTVALSGTTNLVGADVNAVVATTTLTMPAISAATGTAQADARALVGKGITINGTVLEFYNADNGAYTGKAQGIDISDAISDVAASVSSDIINAIVKQAKIDGVVLSAASSTTLKVAASEGGVAGNQIIAVDGGKDNKFSATFQIGANSKQSMTIDINDMRADALDVSGTVSGGTIKASNGNIATLRAAKEVTDGTNNTAVEYALDVSDHSKATAAISVIEDAIESVSAERSKLGAYTNRLEHTVANLTTSSENLTSAESRIRDVDMAKEMMNFQKNNILSQAAQAMLAQANQQPQGVLQLLR